MFVQFVDNCFNFLVIVNIAQVSWVSTFRWQTDLISFEYEHHSESVGPYSGNVFN